MRKNHCLIVLILNLCLFSSWNAVASDAFHRLEKRNSEISDQVFSLRTAIKQQIEANDIDMPVFRNILKLHKSIAEIDISAAQCRPKKLLSFYHPAFCDYSLRGSFGGQWAETCCEDEPNERVDCCAYGLRIGCFPIQLLLGCLMPCGHNWDKKAMKRYLRELQKLYDDSSWD